MKPIKDKVFIRLNLWVNNIISSKTFFIVDDELKNPIHRRTGFRLRNIVKDYLERI